MESEKVKELKEALEQNDDNGIIYEVNGNKRICKFIHHKDILTLINELESENERLMKLQARGGCRVAELGIENQQLKDRIKNQRMTKKGFRYEILPSTEYSPRRVKDYNEYCTLYNRLAELEDKIEDGTLAELKDYRRN